MIDWEAMVIAPCQRVFGEPAKYTMMTPVSQRTFDISVIFDDAYASVEVGGMAAITTRPTVGVMLSDFPADFDPETAQGDSIMIVHTSATYDVASGKKDNHGGARLTLNKIERWEK